MDTYTKLNSAVPLSSTSDGVWKIQKKSKTDDHRRRGESNRKKKKEDKDTRDGAIFQKYDKEIDVETLDTIEEIGYGSANRKTRVKGKVDLTI